MPPRRTKSGPSLPHCKLLGPALGCIVGWSCQGVLTPSSLFRLPWPIT